MATDGFCLIISIIISALSIILADDMKTQPYTDIVQ